MGFFVSVQQIFRQLGSCLICWFFTSSSFAMTFISRAEMKKVCQFRWDSSPAFSNTSRSLGIAKNSCHYPRETAPKRPKDPNVLRQDCAGLWDLAGGCYHSKEPFPAPAEGFCHSGGCSILTWAIPVELPCCWTLWKSGACRQLQESPFTL